MGIGHLCSNYFQTIPKGIPHGAVISPILFHEAGPPTLLETIPNLRRAAYAVRGVIQIAIYMAKECLQARGLDCEP